MWPSLSHWRGGRALLSPVALKIAIALAASSLIAIPSILVCAFNASYLTFAPEQIAFRFFLVARLAAGEGGTAWQPQGQLTSLIQQAIYAAVQHILPAANVFDQMDMLGRIYGFTMVVLFAAVLFIMAALPRITTAQALLIAAVPLTIIHLLTAGLWYMAEPSYHQMNIFLFFLASVLFIYFHGAQSDHGPLVRAGILGFFVGLCAANKISLIFIGLPLAAVMSADEVENREYGTLIRATAVAVITAIAVATLIFLALYGFKLHAAAQAFGIVKNFTLHPGDPEPWLFHEFFQFAMGYRYLHAVLAFVLAVLLLVAAGPRNLRHLVLTTAIVLTGAAYAAAVIYRPAGHTVFDMACALISLAAMSLAYLPQTVVTAPRVASLLVVLAIIGVDWHPTFVDDLAKSRQREEIRLQAWNYAAGIGAPIIAVVPDDRWATRGPLPVLIKGLANVPSWNVSSGPLTSMVVKEPFQVRSHGMTEIGLGVPYPATATLIWEDTPNLPAVADLDPELKRTIAGRHCREWHDDKGTLRVCLPLNE